MRKLISVVIIALLLVPPAPAQQAAAPSAAAERAATPNTATRLPVKRVVLYKNGVGFFEHLGRVRGSQDVTIDFTSGQLNDALASLTVLDLAGGRITGVGYNSNAPLDRRLGALRLPLGEKTTVRDFLDALRGARLEARSGSTAIIGRLLSVERKSRIQGGNTREVDEISLVTDAGDVRTVELTPAVSIRLAERDLNQEVGRYLSVLASARERDLRRMVISTAGTGERPLYVSYISEVPIWKTTYRVVLPSKAAAKPLLQGWAIVDNTVGEDWADVELSLVAGAPQSFIQQLSQPYYSRRHVIPLPESAQLTPQTHAATLVPGAGRLFGKVTDLAGLIVSGAEVRVVAENGALIAQGSTSPQGTYEFDSLPAGNLQVEVVTPGFKRAVIQNVGLSGGSSNEQNVTLELGQVTETVTVEAAPSTANTTVSSLSEFRTAIGTKRQLGTGAALGRRESGGGGGIGGGVGGGTAGGVLGGAGPGEARLRAEAAAQARELGDLFEYKLKERVTIRKNQSALVPILQAEIGAEKISLWNASNNSTRPLRALWLTNTSNLTLDGGSFSVLEDETFAGEGLLDAIKPGERRLLSYAVDLGVMVDTKMESDQQRVSRVRIVRGVMMQTSELREKKTFTVRNEDTTTRTVVIEHPVRPGWKLATDVAKPDETASGLYRFRLTVDPKKTGTLTISEVRPLDTTYEISNLDDKQIVVFLRQKSINPEIEQALRRIIEQKNRVAALDEEIEKREVESKSIYDNQARLRENLKALKGSAEEKALMQRYTRQLDQQESRLEALRKETAELGTKRQQAQAELDKMIQDLALDVSL